MGIASLVLGIISIVFGWIPFICFIALILAVIGLILGIVDTIHKNKTGDKKRGVSIAGLIVSAIAIPIILFSSLVSFGIFAAILSEDIDDEWYNDYYYTFFFCFCQTKSPIFSLFSPPCSIFIPSTFF